MWEHEAALSLELVLCPCVKFSSCLLTVHPFLSVLFSKKLTKHIHSFHGTVSRTLMGKELCS